MALADGANGSSDGTGGLYPTCEIPPAYGFSAEGLAATGNGGGWEPETAGGDTAGGVNATLGVFRSAGFEITDGGGGKLGGVFDATLVTPAGGSAGVIGLPTAAVFGAVGNGFRVSSMSGC